MNNITDKYPLWFLTCKKACCSGMRERLRIKVEGENDNEELKVGQVKGYQPSNRSPGFKIDW